MANIKKSMSGAQAAFDGLEIPQSGISDAADLKLKLFTDIEHMKPNDLGAVVEFVKGVQKHPLDALYRKGEIRTVVVVYTNQGVKSFDGAIADRMLSAVPASDTAMEDWNELIGPFYDTAALTTWLGVTKQAISKRIGKTLLAVRAENGDVRYPSFQFLSDGRVSPHLMLAWHTLEAAGLDEWAQAQWLNTPVRELHDRTFAEVFAVGDVSDVRRADQLVALQAARLAA